MFDKLKADILFNSLLKRRDIRKAYKMVGPEDSWYDTITTVHRSLAEIQQLHHENLELVSHDGLRLKAVYYPNNSKKTLIWIHGYTSHAERESAFPGLFYRSLGFNVLIPYLRAHGPSEGKFISFGALEHLDMMRWVDKVNEMIPNGQIVLHGLSMGGGIALDLACKEMDNVKCIVSDAPSVCVSDILHQVANGTFKSRQNNIYDRLLNRFQKEFSADAQAYNRLENIKDGLYPILITAGSNEQMDENLYTIEKNNPKDTKVLILPGCNHGNGMYKQTEMYQSAIREFVGKHLGGNECLN